MSDTSRSKKGRVLQWLFYLKENNYFLWPTHAMYVKDWFDFFETHHPDKRIFTELKYFSRQMNNICRENLFPDLRRVEVREPSYNVMYEIVDNEIPYMIDAQPSPKTEEVVQEDKQTQTDCKYHMYIFYYLFY